MTAHSPEFNAYIETHILELEDDIQAYVQAQLDRQEEIKRLTTQITNLTTEIEAYGERITRVAYQVLELKQALE